MARRHGEGTTPLHGSLICKSIAIKSSVMVCSRAKRWFLSFLLASARRVQDLNTKRVPNNRSNQPHAGLWREVAKASKINALGIQAGRSPGASHALKASIGIPLDARLNRSFTNNSNRIE